MTIFVRGLLGLLGLSVSCCSVAVPVSMQAGSKISRNKRSAQVDPQKDREGQIGSTAFSNVSQSGLTFDDLWETIKQGFNLSNLSASSRVDKGPIKLEFQNILKLSSDNPTNWSVVVQKGNNCSQIRSSSQNICGYLYLKQNELEDYKLGIAYDGNQGKVKVVRLKAGSSNAEYGNLQYSKGVDKNRVSFPFENLNVTSKDLGEDIQDSLVVSLTEGK